MGKLSLNAERRKIILGENATDVGIFMAFMTHSWPYGGVIVEAGLNKCPWATKSATLLRGAKYYEMFYVYSNVYSVLKCIVFKIKTGYCNWSCLLHVVKLT